MLKKIFITCFVTLLVTLNLYVVYANHQDKKLTESISQTQISELKQQLAILKSQEEQDMALGQYVINMMYQTRAGNVISNALKQVIAQALVRITNSVFDNPEHRKAFVAVVAIESEFLRTAQSPTGPRGLSQVAKAAFKEGLQDCGITDIKDNDVWEMDINLYAGACYFKTLLEKSGGDPYIAIVAYNQGLNSTDMKTYSRTGWMDGKEALKYVARFNYLKRTVKEEKAPEAPAIKANLAKPASSVKVENKAAEK